MSTATGVATRLLGHPLLDGLPLEELRDVAPLLTVEVLERGQRLGRGSRVALCLVIAGRVRVDRRSADGRRLTVALPGPGDAFAQPVNGSSGHLLEAVDGVEAGIMDAERLDRAVACSAALAVAIARLVAGHVQEVEQQLERLAFQPVSQRLAAVVWELAERFGRVTPTGIRLEGRLTHAELGDMVAASRETLTKALSALRGAGLLEVRDGALWVLDAPGLERAASGS